MDGEIAKASGRMDYFLGLQFQRHLARSILGAWRFAWIALFFAIASLTVTFMAAGALGRENDLLKAVSFACLLIAIAACLLGFHRLTVRRFRQRWLERGVPGEIELSFVVATDGLHISSETGKTVINWPYLSEIDLVRDCWLVIGAAWALPLPRRFFATPAEERAFLSKVLERMTPAARTRSVQATNLVSAG